VDIALQQNALLESAKIGTEITRADIQIARAGRMPTLDLVASYGNSRVDGEQTTFDVFAGTDPVTGEPILVDRTNPNTSDSDDLSYGVQFALPVFSGGGVSSQIQEAVYLHRAARENYERVARQTERESRDAYLGVIAEIARVQALARSVESNNVALQATEAGYDVGTRTTVDVLVSRDSLFRAQTLYARAKYDYLINVLRLKQASGTLEPEDVAELNNWLARNADIEKIPGRGGAPDAQMEETSVPSNPGAEGQEQYPSR
jgi:outer membrane protein